jgi:hypothetical protein
MGGDRAKAKKHKNRNQYTHMKKCSLRGIAIVAITGFVLALRAQDATTTDQSQYPSIVQQPVDQCVPVGSPVTFSVVASNADSYQWYKNNAAIDGQTNSSLTIASVAISDVAYYSAAVLKGSDGVPTRMANLNVYTVSGSTTTTTSGTGKNRFAGAQTMSAMMATDIGGGGVVTVFGAPVVSGGGSGSCPGKYSGYVNFIKTASQGWGWAPTAGVQTHAATDNNRSDTKIVYTGQYGDSGCGSNSVTLGYQMSPVYRFSIYFPTNTAVPTNAYAITLDGFDP